MPDVSVVIPTRNRAMLLGQALRSVLAQRDVCVEVVVVDDGSTDDTRSSVQDLAEPRVKLLVNDRSQGVASARNRGVAHAIVVHFPGQFIQGNGFMRRVIGFTACEQLKFFLSSDPCAYVTNDIVLYSCNEITFEVLNNPFFPVLPKGSKYFLNHFLC